MQCKAQDHSKRTALHKYFKKKMTHYVYIKKKKKIKFNIKDL